MNHGGRVLFNLSFLKYSHSTNSINFRSVSGCFIEPFFVLILLDFTARLSNLRNERHLSQKLQPMMTLVAAVSVVRLLYALPSMFIWIDDSTLREVEGQVHYTLTYERSPHYLTLELFFTLLSLTLMLLLTVWLRTRLLLGLWLLKVVLLLSHSVFGLQLFIFQDLVEVVNLLILYMYLNLQTLLCDVEDSREKLDRFFSYNFLFFEDD